MESYALKMHGICMSFNGVPVLKDINFNLEQGEIKGLIGKNGAGKSTLLKIIQGIYKPVSGSIRIFGEELNSEHKKASEYVGMIFQEFSLVSEMTVLQNIYLNSEIKKHGLIDEKECEKRVRDFFQEYDINIDLHKRIKELSSSDMQMVEICKAVLKNKRIILMDEPTAALDGRQCEKLFAMIKRLKENRISVVLITHHLKEIIQNCDSVTVIRDGCLTLDSAIGKAPMEKIITAMLGEERDALQKKRSVVAIDRSAPLLEVKGITSAKFKKPLSFRLYPGEVLGLAGLKGSGRTELFKLLFGVDPRAGGEILLEGKPLKIRHPADAVDAGFFLIPESRQIQGLSVDHSVKLNMELSWLKHMKKHFLLDDKKGDQVAAKYIGRLQIKTQSLDTLVRSLSGGNQQKVVIAKALATNPKVLLMDDPTFGVDVHAKAEIMGIIDEFKQTGGAVILASSEIEEISLNCGRILIMKDQEITGELKNDDFETITQDELTAAIQ